LIKFDISANFSVKFTHLKETGMSFKKYNSQPSFFDLELKQSFGNSRTQKFLIEVMDAIDWKPVSTILTEHYPVGKSEFGNKPYHPLMLLKALLLQKWFGIKSDPELENQINDRLSFKAFIGLPFGEPSPVIRLSADSGKGSEKLSWKRFSMNCWNNSTVWAFPSSPGWLWMPGLSVLQAVQLATTSSMS
jgi:hypothetical protein